MGTLFRTWRLGPIEWRSHEEDERLARALLGDADPRNDAGRWRTVQENRHRTIRRVEGLAPSHAEGPSPGAYLKVIRTRGAARRLRSLFWGDQAWREWTSAQELHGRRLPVPRPLAYGGGGGNTLYLCETLAGARTLPELLASLPTATGIHARLGAFVARLHDAGVSHPDLHISNILFSGPDGTPHLLDLHTARIRRKVRTRRRAKEIGVLLGSLGWMTATDRLRIALGYARACRYDRARTRRFARDAFRAAQGAVRKHLASRTRRPLKRSSGFERDKRDRWRAIWRAGTGLGLESLRTLVTAHREARSAGGADVRKSAPETAVTVGHDLAGFRICVKAYRPRGLLDRLRGLVRRRRARRAWIAAHGLSLRGVPVPEPLAIVEHGAEGFLVSREVVPGRQLDTLLAERGAAWLRTPEAAELLESLARLLRRGFRHNVRFGDLKGCNIVVRESPGIPPEAVLTDVDGTRFPRWLPRQARLRAFLQLNTSVPRAVPLRVRVAFLRAVLRGKRRAAIHWYARACAQVSLTREILYVGPQGDVRETWNHAAEGQPKI